mgnify:FL=1
MSTFRLIRTAVELSISFAVAGIATKAIFKKPDEKVVVRMDNSPIEPDEVDDVTNEEVEESI